MGYRFQRVCLGIAEGKPFGSNRRRSKRLSSGNRHSQS
jgi:hypothetical protein